MGPQLNGTGDMVTWDMEKSEVLNVIFASLFTNNNIFQESQAPEASEKVRSKTEKDQDRQYLLKLNKQEPTGPD